MEKDYVLRIDDVIDQLQNIKNRFGNIEVCIVGLDDWLTGAETIAVDSQGIGVCDFTNTLVVHRVEICGHGVKPHQNIL